MPRNKSTLSAKQSIFVEEYLVDLNATQAAIRAGYSEDTAQQIGSENLSKPVIQGAIQVAMNERSKRIEITADNVLKELGKLAFADPRNLFNADGSLKVITELDEFASASIAGMDVSTIGKGDDAIGTITKIRFSDKGVNLERLGKHLKLFTDKIEHSGRIDFSGMSHEERERRIKQLEAKREQSLMD